MCGLTGFWDHSHRWTKEACASLIQEMTDTLAHRGPDDSGTFQDAFAGIALGFRRLAIQDVSPSGHQPMRSASGRYTVVYNGEVYNVAEMRAELQEMGNAPVWRGTSDTETMLAAIEAWGIESAVSRFIGMFAIALWDTHTQTLTLVRDRLGIKPLYYGWMGGTFLFGSELKALRAHPAFVAEINREALTSYLRNAYVLSPFSIYSGVSKLPPGMILRVKSPEESRVESFWSLDTVIDSALEAPFSGSDEEAVEAFLDHARRAVRSRMLADVPLGAFLSGGLDSSLVVALMQEASSRPVQTFCIGFTEDAYNEADQARAVADHLGTEHYERLATPAEAMEVIPRLPDLYDEPFADPSQIPTLLVSAVAREKVTVALSGDGGDELLAGYNSYTHGEQIRAYRGRLGPLTGIAGGAAKRLPPEFYQTVLGGRYTGDRIHKLADVFGYPPSRIHRYLMSHWKHPERLTGFDEAQAECTVAFGGNQTLSPLYAAMYEDMRTYLPDDILCKVDRASMGVALEARVPLLDHRFVAFCWSLPMSSKRRDGKNKWILRKALERYLPTALFDRPKRGFGVPIDEWLRGPLRPWAEELLTESRLANGGMLEAKPIRDAWKAHLTGVRNFAGPLWCVLMLQSWRERWNI